MTTIRDIVGHPAYARTLKIEGDEPTPLQRRTLCKMIMKNAGVEIGSKGSLDFIFAAADAEYHGKATPEMMDVNLAALSDDELARVAQENSFIHEVQIHAASAGPVEAIHGLEHKVVQQVQRVTQELSMMASDDADHRKLVMEELEGARAEKKSGNWLKRAMGELKEEVCMRALKEAQSVEDNSISRAERVSKSRKEEANDKKEASASRSPAEILANLKRFR